MNQLLKSIEEYNKIFPIEEMEMIRNAKSEYIDELIDSIKYATKNAEKLRKSKSKYFLHIYAIYLLAEFREKKAFPVIADFIELNRELFEFISFEMITDHLESILASTFNGDQQRLNRVIENKEASEYVRGCALEAYKILVHNQIIPKEDFVQFLRGFIQAKLDAGPYDDPNNWVFITLIIVITELNLYDLRHIVFELYENGYIDRLFVGDYSDFIDDVFRKHDITKTFIDDGIKELISFKGYKNRKLYKQKKVPSQRTKRTKRTIPMDDREFADRDLARYPRIHGRDGLKGLSDFYDAEAIEIDMAMYKAISKANLDDPFSDAFMSLGGMGGNDVDNSKREALLERFELVYQLALSKASMENIDKLEEYDKKYMIHYSLLDFIDEYCALLKKEFRRTSNPEHLDKAKGIIEEILDGFTMISDYEEYLNGKLERLGEMGVYPY